MDTATLLQNIYQYFREKRLADVVELLSDDFKYKAQLPDDLPGDGMRARSRAELALITHKSMQDFDVLALEPGPIMVADGHARAEPAITFKHKKSGKILEMRFVHDWRVADGKAQELEQWYDVEQLQAFVRSLDGEAD
jgi:ketosteroid isomerase-like protein